MAAALSGPEIERLVQLLSRLPGLGPRSARRAVLFLLKRKDALLVPLTAALEEAGRKIQACLVCGNLDSAETCSVFTVPTSCSWPAPTIARGRKSPSRFSVFSQLR